jgi:hypothetical protein
MQNATTVKKRNVTPQPKLSIKQIWTHDLGWPLKSAAMPFAERAKALGSDDDLVLSTEEAALFLGISSRTLEKWRGTGEGPPYCKMSRRVGYRLGDLRKWLNRKNRGSTSE